PTHGHCALLNKQPTDQLHVHAAALTALRQRQLPVMHTCQAELAPRRLRLERIYKGSSPWE
ncbi:hypothetical protein, partial [Xanthomonas fragariae]|uniref:hypothetical protein n=1 Tax=Xanthomonas fragariae TaxID=48664 RepID=UPI0035308FBF